MPHAPHPSSMHSAMPGNPTSHAAAMPGHATAHGDAEAGKERGDEGDAWDGWAEGSDDGAAGDLDDPQLELYRREVSHFRQQKAELARMREQLSESELRQHVMSACPLSSPQPQPNQATENLFAVYANKAGGSPVDLASHLWYPCVHLSLPLFSLLLHPCQGDKLEKLFTAYANKVGGLPVGSLKFVFDGDALRSDSTPADLDLEDEDQIEAIKK
ncbi:unnamed protein product [Closterium sp. Yama58-4]|nr:unnamed protein product [Closterium sp. Yama58-4]